MHTTLLHQPSLQASQTYRDEANYSTIESNLLWIRFLELFILSCLSRLHLSCVVVVFHIVLYLSKFFTYVTKTCANLSTYSRKPGNCIRTINFEIDIMKKSSQSIKIFVKIDFFTNVLVVWFVFVNTATLLRTSANCTRKKVPFWFWQWKNCEF